MAYKFTTLVPDGSSGGISINGVIEQYKVNAGTTVNAGDFVEFVNKFNSGTFNSGAASYVSACKLDNSRVLIAYQDVGNSNYGTAVVLSVGDTGIAVGAASVFKSATTSYISSVALTDSKVLVAYRDEGNSNKGTAIVLTVDGTTITAGTAKVFEFNLTSYISVVALTDSKVLVAYQNPRDGGRGKAIVLTVSGTTITAGTAVVFESAYIQYTYVVALSESKVLVAYNYFTNSYCVAIVLTVSGTTITAGTAKVVNSGSTSYTSVVALTDSKVLVAYQNGGNSNYGTAVILTVDGTTITAGIEKVFESAATSYTSVVALTDSKVLVAYCDEGNSNKGTAIVLTVDGTTITAGAAVVFDYNTVNYTVLVAFSETSALVAYNNTTGAFSNLLIDGTAITADGAETGTYVQPAKDRLHNVGVAKTGGSEGETVEVYCVARI